MVESRLKRIIKGEIKKAVKAAEIVAWLKNDFNLGHGHAMAIYAVFKGIKQAKQKDD